MKIQCNVCQLAEANVVCCADEAALCWSCDDKVHAANKLASKHQRVPLTTSASQIPNCDICQETVGYFFCLEDRALLCRKCDVAIHTANTFVSAHRRFLLTGVKVADSPTTSIPMPTTNTPLSDSQLNKMQSMQISQLQDHLLFTGDTAIGTIPQWHLDDLLGPTDFNHTYAYMGNGSSKADHGKLGDSDDSSILRAGEEELDGDECSGQVPDSHWAVPQVCSPPTASGIYWPKTHQNQPDVAAFVPDICHSPLQNFNRCQPNGSSIKRRRQI